MHLYPATLQVTPPVRWNRAQVFLRIGIFAILGFLGTSLGWLFGALYLVLPLVAAVVISTRGSDGYLSSSAKQVVRGLRAWNAILAYLAFVTDAFPTDERGLAQVGFEVMPRGTPTVGSALLRLLTSVPELVVVVVLFWVGGLVWLIAAIAVLLTEQMPDFAWRYLRYVVALQARLFAYHASLIDIYPPLAEPTGHGLV